MSGSDSAELSAQQCLSDNYAVTMVTYWGKGKEKNEGSQWNNDFSLISNAQLQHKKAHTGRGAH